MNYSKLEMKIYKTVSFGKILISSEYFVLKGALALAIPTKFKQSLTFFPIKSDELNWKSFDYKNKLWFECIIKLSNFTVTSSTNKKRADLLLNLLKSAKKFNKNFLKKKYGGKVETNLDFPLNWGLGSSSTLINNISKWAKINPYDLLWANFKGSGYDIACSESDFPIHYQLRNHIPQIKKVSFNPSFHDKLFFVHLNQKQKTEDQISYFENKKTTRNEIDYMTNLTKKITNSKTIYEFKNYLKEHEFLLSEKLNINSIKDKKFLDYPGEIKSLGAWGGDFILAAGPKSSYDYFNEKGYETIIPFKKMLK